MDANRRSREAGFTNAAAQEQDANRRAIFAGYKNAALQEMDANRRAQSAGYANAAVQENTMAAFPMGLLQMSGLINMASNLQSLLNLPQNQINFGFNPQNWSWGQSPFNPGVQPTSPSWLFGRRRSW